MTSGPFDRPGPQRDVFAGELHQLGIALGRGVNSGLAEHAPSSGVDHG